MAKKDGVIEIEGSDVYKRQVLYRVGTFIPAPGVSYGNVQQCLNANVTSGGVYDIVNLFSGGALLQLSIFALGVMPYITASIIIQLLRVVCLLYTSRCV